MAAPIAGPNVTAAVSPDQLITIKVAVNEQLKKLKLPLRDLGMGVLPNKLRLVLGIKPEQHMILERYSDSVAGYVTINEDNAQVFKTLIRAAKAKLKLRLKITVTPSYSFDAESAKLDHVPSSDAQPPAARDSTALDGRSIGSGIFQFREARASRQSLPDGAAPLIAPVGEVQPPPIPPKAPGIRTHLPSTAPLPIRTTTAPAAEPTVHSSFHHAWSVYCNACDSAMDNAHFHCSICDGGDYDLCEACVAKGTTCRGDNHWLIKRFIEDGKVVTGSTTRVPPRKAAPVSDEKESAPATAPCVVPATTPAPSAPNAAPVRAFTRTCNNCVVILPEHLFVTCTSCPDFDLCIMCHTDDKHGHHPAHAFEPAKADTVMSLAAKAKLAPGRNVCHNAICDGCDKKIYGIRHKCLNCPDWDYCDACVKNARIAHPRHRFAPLYEPIAHPRASTVRHYGVYCNGPLCSNNDHQTYIVGVRYKCTICHDTDFCAACEALPGNHHNQTHPLIKLKTHVREVNVSTEKADDNGCIRILGDRQPSPARAWSATAPKSSVEVDAVQTVADFQPTEVKKVEKIETGEKDLSAQNMQEVMMHAAAAGSGAPTTAAMLTAHFVRDSVQDGQVFSPDTRFTQVWTLRNPGPYPWPAGCSVKFVGGDNMLNIDNSHPATAAAIEDAIESNVVARPVLGGEEVAFKVILKAPTREGNSISYWRLKAPDGTPFGHRLWCDIKIKTPGSPLPQCAAENAPRVPQQMTLEQMQARHHAHLAQSLKAQRAAFSSASKATDVAHLKALHDVQVARRQQLLMQLQAQRDCLNAATQASQASQAYPQMLLNYDQPLSNQALTEKALQTLRQRCELAKAEILKTRTELGKNTVHNEARSANAEPTAEVAAEVVEKEASTPAPAQAEELATSQMVFPKLDKESPVSSTYESATSRSGTAKPASVENEQGEVEESAARWSATPEHATTVHRYAESAFSASSPPRAAFMTDDSPEDDIEILSAVNDEESETDGFLTDDEYDILDASDRETVY